MHDSSSLEKSNRLILAVLAIGIVIRVIALIQTPVVNNDGPLYIHQARAVLNHDWHLARSCGFPYLSLYPFAMPLYWITGDWTLAGQLTSLLFGFLSLIPVYLISRSFFDKTTASLVTLVFALNPTLVELHVDVNKDPIAWFFCAMGLYFFVKSSKNGYLVFSSLCFLTAL